MARIPTLVLPACAALLCAGMPAVVRAQAPATVEQFNQLRQENKNLQEQLRRQQELIETLTSKMNRIEKAGNHHDEVISESSTASMGSAAKNSASTSFGHVSLSAEGGVGFFDTGREGIFPKSEFRLDEAKLFIEAPIWNHVYFFSEINLALREQGDVNLNLGECYLDFENVSSLWNRDRMLNLRIGRLDIPFGEEYLTRDAIDNPLISHSLTDFWGVDEGIELYGKLGPVRYVIAAQNGGVSDTRDFDSDKSVAGRLEYDPLRWLHLSVSAMRTGNLNVENDQLSALWFGNGFFRSIGSTSTTKFHADMVQGDIGVWLPHGHLSAFGGYIRYDDNDPLANNKRDVYYYSIEGIHDIVGKKLYAGARFSQIFAPKGYPISGQGDMGDYFFNPFALTKEIWRLSLGVGYRFNQNLVVKAEYSLERARQQDGQTRDHEDMFALEAAFKF